MVINIAEIGTQIVNALKSTFGLLPELGKALLDMLNALVFQSTTVEGVTTYTLSSFVVFALVFGGVALCIGISKWVTHWVGRKQGK